MKRIIAGPRAVLEALRADAGRVAVVYHQAEQAPNDVRETARRSDVRCERRGRSELEALAPELNHQGIVAVTGDYPYRSLEEITAAAAPAPLLLALDQIQDPHNFGAIVRSAVALGADGVITLKNRACPVSSAVVRASAGATEHARIARVTNLARTLDQLDEQGLQTVGLDAEGSEDLAELPYSEGGRVLVVGAEGTGLRRLVREKCRVLARIPLVGPVASLNASVAAAIALHASARQREIARGNND